MAFKSTAKRLRPTTFDSDSDEEIILSQWSRFIVVTGGDELKHLHAIAICKGIQGMAGGYKNIKRLRSGDLLIEVACKQHSENLLKTTTLATVPVTCTPHRTLNSCKGVVRAYESTNCTEEELKEWLTTKGVIDVKRPALRGTAARPTPTLFLTFHGNRLPESILIGFEHCRVEPYVPNPLRCFRCQQYGHHKNACRNPETCSNCGSHEHTSSREDPCNNTPKCVNCDGNHPAYKRECPQWKEQRNIQELKVKHNITYGEARKMANNPERSYAAVVNSKNACSVATQTLVQPPSPDSPEKTDRVMAPSRVKTQTTQGQSISTQSVTAAKTETKVTNAANTKEQISTCRPATHTTSKSGPGSRSGSRNRPRNKSKVDTTSPAHEDLLMEAEPYSTPKTDPKPAFIPDKMIEGPKSN